MRLANITYLLMRNKRKEVMHMNKLGALAVVGIAAAFMFGAVGPLGLIVLGVSLMLFGNKE